jgi:hypothetical protein
LERSHTFELLHRVLLAHHSRQYPFCKETQKMTEIVPARTLDPHSPLDATPVSWDARRGPHYKNGDIPPPHPIRRVESSSSNETETIRLRMELEANIADITAHGGKLASMTVRVTSGLGATVPVPSAAPVPISELPPAIPASTEESPEAQPGATVDIE